MQIFGMGTSDKGQTRDSNEDAMFIDNELQLYMVSDGMGGHDTGEIAARMAVDTVSQCVAKQKSTLEKARDRLEESKALLGWVLTDAMQVACRTIYNQSRATHTKMGCTATALLVIGHKACVAHVGGSRLYLLRHGKLHQLTSDHTMAAELVQAGVLTEEQIQGRHCAHLVLTRCLGHEPSVQIDGLLLDLMPGDRLLVCSDGLSGVVDPNNPSWILETLKDDGIEDISSALVDHASWVGSRDNISAVVVSASYDEEMPRHTPDVCPEAQGGSTHHPEWSTSHQTLAFASF